MKLELKHLAPYLPYDLKVMHHYNYYLTMDATGELSNTLSILDVEEYAKPILRPLSDLSKLGVESIPINEHTINALVVEKFNESYGIFEHYKGILCLVKEGDSSQRYDSDKTINFEIFEFVRSELLKAHYDIFGLIEKGLAIDINTL